MSRKFVLTGTTGGLGSHVLKHLLHLVPAPNIIVSLHNIAGAPPSLYESGVEVRHGDFTSPATLDTAFAGTDALLLVSYPSISHDLRVRAHIAAIDAAKRCGITHIYYTSLAFGSGSVAAVMQAHLDTEAYLKTCGLTYTILREGIYSESYPLYLGMFDPADEREILIPHSDGGIAWVSREDLGEGTAKIIASGGYKNETLLLSGSKSLTLRDLVTRIARILKRDVKLRVVAEDEYVKRHIGTPGPRGEEWFLRAWSTTYLGLQRGELDIVDPLLQAVLERELKPVEETLKEMLNVSGEGQAMDQYAK